MQQKNAEVKEVHEAQVKEAKNFLSNIKAAKQDKLEREK